MKRLTKILTSISLLVEIINGQCLGDLNMDYRIDEYDLNIFSNHLLFNNDTLLTNADFDYNNSLDIFDLILIADEITFNGIEWCEFENVDLSVDWEEQIDSLYYDHENLQAIMNNNINNLPDIRGLIIIHRGKIVGEKYYNSSNMNQSFNIWSVTKSYISTLIGQAIDMEYIFDEDIMLNEIFIENDYTNQVSIEHLLTMRSGWPENWSYMNTNNVINTLLSTPLMNTPGAIFFYNNAACHINSHIINTMTNINPKEFAMEYLFPHVGINNPTWTSDADGINNGSYGLYLTLREMVKLGQLYLQNGKSDDLQILSPEWIGKATSNQINPGGDGYGYLWWLTDNSYLALGLGGQIIAVFPNQQLVIGSHSYAYSNNNYFSNLMDIIFSIIFPIFDISSNSFNYQINIEDIKNIYNTSILREIK